MWQIEVMTDTHPHYNDEIDLFELIETLWNGKVVIIAATTMALIIGGLFSIFLPKTYQSSFTLEYQLVSPLETMSEINSKFRRLFHNQKNYQEWKQLNPNSSVTYNEITTTQTIDGFTVAIKPESLFAQFIETKSGNLNLRVKSNDFKILEDMYLYLQFTDKMLSQRTLLKAKQQTETLQTSLSTLLSATENNIANNENTLISVLNIQSFASELENGNTLYSISRPSFPSKTSLSIRIILLVSLIMGGMIGVAIVLVKNAIQKRREQTHTG